jgi:Fe-S-cluster containining protein
MPLSLDDVRRLQALGFRVKDFSIRVHGERRLRNVEGRCFFLGESGCRVYDSRPAGCRFYPLVVDGSGRVRVDEGCRYRDRFTVDPVDAERLRGLMRRLRRERRRELW